MIRNATSTPVRAIILAYLGMARELAKASGDSSTHKLKVFVDCDPWLEDEIRPDTEFVTCVDGAEEADVCMAVTPDTSHGRARHYRVQFFGMGTFACIEASARLHLPRRRISTYPRLQHVNSHSATA
jgi:hypothetical protein